MQENTPITQSLVYDLTRQNQGILIDLKEADKTIAQLTLEQRVIKNGHLELLLRLAKANEKIDHKGVAIFAKDFSGLPARKISKKLRDRQCLRLPRFVLVTSFRPNKGSKHRFQMT